MTRRALDPDKGCNS